MIPAKLTVVPVTPLLVAMERVEVAVLPAPSTARAVTVCGPSETLVELHATS